MRKHEEGYTLPFVLVVMLVLCLVAVSVLTFSLNNLKQQKQSVQRMQDQYIAQGQIEKVVALVEEALVNGNQGGVVDALKDKEEVRALADSKIDTGKLVLTARSGDVSITCVLLLDDIHDTVTYESYIIGEYVPPEPTETQEVTADGQ